MPVWLKCFNDKVNLLDERRINEEVQWDRWVTGYLITHLGNIVDSLLLDLDNKTHSRSCHCHHSQLIFHQCEMEGKSCIKDIV